MISQAFIDWANQDGLQRVVVATCTLTRRSDGQPLVLRIADGAPLSGTWDGQNNWENCIKAMPEINYRAQALDRGESMASRGQLVLATDSRAKLGPDGDLSWDRIKSEYRWAGGAFQALVGGPDLPFADWALAHSGFMGRASHTDTQTVVPICGPAEAIRKTTIPPNTYGDEVPEASRGKQKPFCLGYPKNISPVLIGENPWIYQGHDPAYGPVQGIPVVRVNGAVQASGFTTNLTNATISFPAAPQGQVTADMQGWVRGGVYLQSAPQIMQALLDEFGPAGISLDAAGFAAAVSAAPWPVAKHLTSQAQLQTVLDDLCKGLPLLWTDDLLGRLTAFLVEPPTGTPDLEVWDGYQANPPYGSVIGYKWKTEPSKLWLSKVTMYGDRNWTTMNPETVSAADLAWLGEQWRSRAVVTSAPADNAFTEEAEYESGLVSLADCQTAAGLMADLHGQERKLVTFDSLYAGLKLRLGSVVRVVRGCWGMESGWLGVVVGLSLRLPHLAQVTLWGAI